MKNTINKNSRLSFLILINLLFSVNIAFSTQYLSVGPTGDWQDAASWSPAGVPDCGDTIYVQSGHTIEINANINYSSCTEPMFLEVDGTIHFTGPGSKLRLPAGSGIAVNDSGSLVETGGGDASKVLQIGGVTMWSGSDGDVSGPFGFGSTLPVELKSFEAIFNEDHVDFYWITASEINSSHFVVERSKDGTTWDEVLNVEAAGNSSSEIEYYDYDAEPLYGKSYYRLVQYDLNGDAEAFNIVPVENLEGGLVAFDIFPNPTTQDNINLSFKGFEGREVLVVLRDITGKEYYSKVEIVNTDSEIIAYSPDVTLPKGVYLVSASSENELYSQKIIIK